MGRRRRRVVRIVKKKLPTVFTCPRCGEEAVRVTVDKQTGNATVLCALCQLKDEFPAHPAAQMIDVYSYFTDRFYGVKDPRAIIPREREHVAPMEEPVSEPEEPEIDATGEESTAIEVAPQTSLTEIPPNATSEPSEEQMTQVQGTATASTEAAARAEQPTAEEAPMSPEVEDKSETEDEAEPFADILGESKDKKRYSPNPLPPQTSEEA